MKNTVLIDSESKLRWDFDQALKNKLMKNGKKEISNLNQGNLLQTTIRYLKYFSLQLCIEEKAV